jgi:hypothetical protein
MTRAPKCAAVTPDGWIQNLTDYYPSQRERLKREPDFTPSEMDAGAQQITITGIHLTTATNNLQ